MALIPCYERVDLNEVIVLISSWGEGRERPGGGSCISFHGDHHKDY